MTTVLIPLHFNQYKAIQNIHKGRDVRSDIPETETAEYLALKNDYDIIYEYMINKNPEQLKDGDELIFEERKSIRDTSGTGRILAKKNRIKTNYLGTKARVKPTEGDLPAPPPPPPVEPLRTKPKEETLDEWKARNPASKALLDSDGDEHYWLDSFYRQQTNIANNSKTDLIAGKNPNTGKYEWFLAPLQFGEPDFSNWFNSKTPRPIYRIRDDYSGVRQILAYTESYEYNGRRFDKPQYYVWDYKTQSITTNKEMNDRRMADLKQTTTEYGVVDLPLKKKNDMELLELVKTDWEKANPRPNNLQLRNRGYDFAGGRFVFYILDDPTTIERNDFGWYFSLYPEEEVIEWKRDTQLRGYKFDWDKMEIERTSDKVRVPLRKIERQVIPIQDEE